MDPSKLTPREKSRIITEKSLDYVPDPRGLGFEFYQSMLRNKNAVAQIDPTTNTSYTYDDLLLRSSRVCFNLLHMGITKDDTICQCSVNHLDSSIPVISGFLLGLPVANLDPSLPLDDAIHILNKIRPRIMFVCNEGLKLMVDAIDEVDIDCAVVVFGSSYVEDFIEFDTLVEETDDEPAFKPLPIGDLHQTAVILFSRGSSGPPKGVCLSYYTLLVQTVHAAECWHLGEGFKVAMGFGSFHTLTALTLLICSTMTGITRVVCEKFEPATTWKLVDKYDVSFIICTTQEVCELYTNETPEAVTGKSLKMLVTTGTSLRRVSLLELRKRFPFCFITNIYQNPEVGGALSMYNYNKPVDIRDQYQKPTSCGKLFPGITIKIVDPITEMTLSANTAGELRYKADFKINDHFKEESSNSDAKGWCKSGQIAMYDERRCIFVLGPYEDVFQYKCWHIVPSIVEAVLRSHVAVKDAVVIGKPHRNVLMGEKPMGIVSLNKGMKGRVTEQDLEEYANSILSNKQQLRAGVMIVSEIPYTLDGKPRRQEVKSLLFG
ncbi:luciferin 4-monooxygenase-like isoform X1 [Zophobas morio]|uniref:luciferin 4-monooxygenase-like isoform X1 n=1 Tax=Zophobas morio TaxID=2755281 RepID=UPI003083BDF6